MARNKETQREERDDDEGNKPQVQLEAGPQCHEEVRRRLNMFFNVPSWQNWREKNQCRRSVQL